MVHPSHLWPPFDAHIAVSRYTAEELRAALYNRAPGFVRTCGMGVDARAFHPSRGSDAVRARLRWQVGGSAATTLLMYAGRLSPEKNIGLLSEVMDALAGDSARDFRLIVAGEGPAADRLRGHPRIWLCGNVDSDTLAQYVASCDVFVHPNPREPFGIGPLEAMASGIPVVAPTAGGVLEYASSGNAWLAAPTRDEYASAIRAASNGDSSRTAAARETAIRFSWDAATTRFFATYDELLRQFAGTLAQNRPDVVSAAIG